MSQPIGIYVRVSRKGDREDERFHSPREQAERAAALAAARGYAVGPTFEDIDVSGATAPARRPAMAELLRAVEAGELAGIAAYSLDRLSREPAHGDALVKRVTKAGGVLLTPDIPDAIDSPTGEFTFGMLLQVAKLYRSQAGARFASAKERATRAGIPVGPPPTGYRVREDRRLEVDPVAIPVIRTVFERWTAGEGRGTLAAYMDAHYPRPDGAPWSRSVVDAIIRNPIYRTGRLEYGGVVSEHDAGATVDEATWHAAQRAKRVRPARSDAGWLLTGLAKCGACGRHLHVTTNRSQYGTYRNYKCRNRACPARVSVSAIRLEAWVTKASFTAGDEVVTRSEAPDLGALEDGLASAERRLEQVMADGAADDLGELWAPEVRRRREARDEAAAALGDARSAAGVAAIEFRLRDVWDDMAPADRRSALRLFWKEARVTRTNGDVRVTLVARGPHAEAEVDLPTTEGPA